MRTYQLPYGESSIIFSLFSPWMKFALSSYKTVPFGSKAGNIIEATVPNACFWNNKQIYNN